MLETNSNITPIAVDVKTLQAMLGLSRMKAMQVGQDAGAVINLGIRRTLYNVDKVKEYINKNSGV